MEPVKPLLKSDKAIQTPAQESQLAEIYAHAMDETVGDGGNISLFSSNVSFTPTQGWLDKFSTLGLYFFQDESVPYAQFHILHKDRPRLWEGPVPPKPAPSWVPQNGEVVEAHWAGWYRAIYIGKDDKGTHVVRTEGTDKEYRKVTEIRPKPKKTQVPLAELLSVYASVKGLTQDGVELKPE